MVHPVDRTPSPPVDWGSEDSRPDKEMEILPVVVLADYGVDGRALWDITCFLAKRSNTPPPHRCEPHPFFNEQAGNVSLALPSPLPNTASSPKSSVNSDCSEIEPLPSIFDGINLSLESSFPSAPTANTSSDCPVSDCAHSPDAPARKRARPPENRLQPSQKKRCQGLDDDKKESMQATLEKVCATVRQRDAAFLIYAPSPQYPDALFPQSKTFPLIPTKGGIKKSFTNTPAGIKHALLSHLERACAELDTNYYQISREKLLENFYEKSRTWFNKLKKANKNEKYNQNFEDCFVRFVDLIRTGQDDLSSLINFNQKKTCDPSKRAPNRFQEIRKRFRQLSPLAAAETPPDVAMLALLDQLYVREPDWPQFVSSTFALLKGQIKTKKVFEEIASLISQSWRCSFLRQMRLRFQDIPHCSLFDELFTFEKFCQ